MPRRDNGRVVKGTKFVELRDAGDPVEIAKRYNNEGADEIIFSISQLAVIIEIPY